MYVHISTHRYHSMNTEVIRQLAEICSFSSMWVPGIKLIIKLDGNHLYLPGLEFTLLLSPPPENGGTP